LVAQPALDMAQTPLELLIAAAQGCFGVDLQMAGQIDHRKQQITHLFLHRALIPAADRLANLFQFLGNLVDDRIDRIPVEAAGGGALLQLLGATQGGDRKSTRLNSSHVKISYAVFCLKKKKKNR